MISSPVQTVLIFVCLEVFGKISFLCSRSMRCIYVNEIFYFTVNAFYDTACQTSCPLPGLICSNGRCQCDPSQRLFWTGARCMKCPNSWAWSGRESDFISKKPNQIILESFFKPNHV